MFNILFYWRYFTCITYTIITITKQSKSLFRTHKFYWYFTAKQTLKKSRWTIKYFERSIIQIWGVPVETISVILFGSNWECKLSFFFFYSMPKQKMEYFLIYYWVFVVAEKCFSICVTIYIWNLKGENKGLKMSFCFLYTPETSTYITFNRTTYLWDIFLYKI